MNEVLNNILTRRSIRRYTHEQVEEGDLRLILEAGRYAPSGSNAQSWRFTVLRNTDDLLELNELVRAAYARVEITEDTYVSIRNGKRASVNPDYSFHYGSPTLIVVSNDRNHPNAMADSACALENMFLAAHSLGLGSCYINQLTWFGDDEGVRRKLTALGIPEGHKVCGSMALGHADGPVPLAPPRKEGTVVIVG